MLAGNGGRRLRRLDEVVSLEGQGKFGRRLPGQVAIEDVGSTVRRGPDGFETETWLDRDGTRRWNRCPVRVLLAEIIVHDPGQRFPGLGGKTKQLVLETIGGFHLVGAVHYPIVHREAIAERIAGAHAHVIKGQKTKPQGA